ncbi:MAG TPA: DNA repair protein, partial [Actinomycetota bacterium]|nr:DNA repair protein [Actinomycetota bacterium]
MRLLTVGHGTASAEELAALLTGAGVARVVDVRTAPG